MMGKLTCICVFSMICQALVAIDLGKVCQERGPLLDCTAIDGADEYEYQNEDISRIVFLRFTGTLDLKMSGLQKVLVREGVVDCSQILNVRKAVWLNTVLCDVKVTHNPGSSASSIQSHVRTSSQNFMRASTTQVLTMQSLTMQTSTIQTVKQVSDKVNHSDEWSHNVFIMTIIPAVIMSLVIITFIIVKVIKLVKRRRRRNFSRDLPLTTLSPSRISSSSETIFEISSVKTD